MVALAELAGIDFHTARLILERRELDALAIVCKAADFDRSLFLTFAVLVLDRDADAMGRAKEYGELYAALPKEFGPAHPALLENAPADDGFGCLGPQLLGRSPHSLSQ